jgi:hypothetical protein
VAPLPHALPQKKIEKQKKKRKVIAFNMKWLILMPPSLILCL